MHHRGCSDLTTLGEVGLDVGLGDDSAQLTDENGVLIEPAMSRLILDILGPLHIELRVVSQAGKRPDGVVTVTELDEPEATRVVVSLARLDLAIPVASNDKFGFSKLFDHLGHFALDDCLIARNEQGSIHLGRLTPDVATIKQRVVATLDSELTIIIVGVLNESIGPAVVVSQHLDVGDLAVPLKVISDRFAQLYVRLGSEKTRHKYACRRLTLIVKVRSRGGGLSDIFFDSRVKAKGKSSRIGVTSVDGKVRRCDRCNGAFSKTKTKGKQRLRAFLFRRGGLFRVENIGRPGA